MTRKSINHSIQTDQLATQCGRDTIQTQMSKVYQPIEYFYTMFTCQNKVYLSYCLFVKIFVHFDIKIIRLDVSVLLVKMLMYFH